MSDQVNRRAGWQKRSMAIGRRRTFGDQREVGHGLEDHKLGPGARRQASPTPTPPCRLPAILRSWRATEHWPGARWQRPSRRRRRRRTSRHSHPGTPVRSAISRATSWNFGWVSSLCRAKTADQLDAVGLDAPPGGLCGLVVEDLRRHDKIANVSFPTEASGDAYEHSEARRPPAGAPRPSSRADATLPMRSDWQTTTVSSELGAACAIVALRCRPKVFVERSSFAAVPRSSLHGQKLVGKRRNDQIVKRLSVCGLVAVLPRHRVNGHPVLEEFAGRGGPCRPRRARAPKSRRRRASTVRSALWPASMREPVHRAAGHAALDHEDVQVDADAPDDLCEFPIALGTSPSNSTSRPTSDRRLPDLNRREPNRATEPMPGANRPSAPPARAG